MSCLGQTTRLRPQHQSPSLKPPPSTPTSVSVPREGSSWKNDWGSVSHACHGGTANAQKIMWPGQQTGSPSVHTGVLLTLPPLLSLLPSPPQIPVLPFSTWNGSPHPALLVGQAPLEGGVKREKDAVVLASPRPSSSPVACLALGTIAEVCAGSLGRKI